MNAPPPVDRCAIADVIGASHPAHWWRWTPEGGVLWVVVPDGSAPDARFCDGQATAGDEPR